LNSSLENLTYPLIQPFLHNAESPQYVIHKTFYSQVLNHEIGYNIYLKLIYRYFIEP